MQIKCSRENFLQQGYLLTTLNLSLNYHLYRVGDYRIKDDNTNLILT